MSELPNTAKDIFLAALDRAEPTDRAAFVTQACLGDATLLRYVEALLSAHDEPDSLLDQPRIDPGMPAATAQGSPVMAQRLAEQLGTRIGPYKLLQVLGEGGMGVVYLAEQVAPVERRVALKIIKPGMDSRQVIARFEAERQALAMMDHVNIARVLDVGTTQSGRPYFVMELVHGVPITQYCDDQRLNPRQRLELFGPVCQAIQHAHQKGIIHRDIKPTNVMVTLYNGQPVPKVIDFGVAKATEQRMTERTLFTQYGALVGTLEYMSPEQAEMSALGADTRSDIFSLGVLLYELLTGSTPLSHKRIKEAAYAEVLRMIREEEAPKPSTRLSDSGEALASISAQRHMEPAKLTKLVRGELDWIVMKTLEKDRSRRYETANGLARDVQRYLADEPVLACPPSAMYRFRKFARRNKAALVTAAVISATLIIGILISTWQAIRATSAERLADQRLKDVTSALQAEEKQRQTAEAQRQAAEQARQRATDNLQLAREAVDQMLTQVGEKELANVPQMEPLRRALLEKALQFYQKFFQGNPEDPGIRLATGEAYQRIGKLYDQFGQYADGEGTHQESIRILEGLVAEFPQEPKYEYTLADTYRTLANVLSHLRQWQKAEQAARQSVVRSRQLTAGFPERAAHRDLLSLSLGHLAVVLGQLGRYPEAEEALREALSLRDPLNPWHRRSLAVAYETLAGLQAKAGRPQEAEETRRRAAQIHEKLVAEFPDNPEYLHGLAFDRIHLGLALQARKQFQEAAKAFQDAIVLNAMAADNYPKTTQFRAGLAESQYYLARLWRDTGRLPEAEPLFRQALEHQMKLVAEAPSRAGYATALRSTFGNLIDLLQKMGKPQEVETVNRQCLQFYERLAADFPKELRYQESLAVIHLNLGRLLRATGRLAEAEQHYRQVLGFYETHPEQEDPKNLRGAALVDLALVLSRSGQTQKAAEIFDQLLKIQPDSAGECNNLAWMLATFPDEKLRHPRRAVELARKAVELDPKLRFIWNTLGVAQYRAGDWQAAIQALEKSMELSNGGDSNDWFFLAMAQWQLGDMFKAREWYDRAVQWIDKNRPTNEELHRFRAEAAELLSVKDKD